MKAYEQKQPPTFSGDPYADDQSDQNRGGKHGLDDEKYGDQKHQFSEFDTVIENPFGDKIFRMQKIDGSGTYSNSNNANGSTQKNESNGTGFTQTFKTQEAKIVGNPQNE